MRFMVFDKLLPESTGRPVEAQHMFEAADRFMCEGKCAGCWIPRVTLPRCDLFVQFVRGRTGRARRIADMIPNPNH